MKALRAYLNVLPRDQQMAVAARAGTTVGYLRKAMSAGQQIGAELCIAIERATSGHVRCEDLRPDVDWAYIRASGARTTVPITASSPATQQEAARG